MANLVKQESDRWKPYEERNAKPGFGYAGGFQDILTAYNGLNHRGANVRYKDNQALFAEQIAHLTELKYKLEMTEQAFFKMFGIYCKNDPKQSFRLLQEKIQSWNSTNAGRLINDASKENEFYKGVQAIQSYLLLNKIPQKKWDEVWQNALESDAFKGIFDKDSGGIANQEKLFQVLNTLGNDKNIKFGTGKNSSLYMNLKIVSKIENNVHKKVVEGKDKISPKLQEKVMTLLDKATSDTKPAYDFEIIYNKLCEIYQITGEAQTCIHQAMTFGGDFSITQHFYSLNSGMSSVKGFLGEVYTTAFLIYMARNGGNKQVLKRITPTGAVRETGGTRPEIITDIWLRGFGIQVKNYESHKVIRDGFQKERSYSVGNFILDTLKLGSAGTDNFASVGDILLNFFTAYDYNQDYGAVDSSVKSSDGYKFWSAARSRMDSKFNDSNALNNILYPYIDRLIGIDKVFSADSVNFAKEREYINTFFNIGGRFIPSSVVVQALIDSIQKNTSAGSLSGLVTAQFDVSYSSSNKDAWHPAVDNNIVAQVFDQRREYANSTELNYKIVLDMKDILVQVYNEILNY